MFIFVCGFLFGLYKTNDLIRHCEQSGELFADTYKITKAEAAKLKESENVKS
jgi:hypothetical protein